MEVMRLAWGQAREARDVREGTVMGMGSGGRGAGLQGSGEEANDRESSFKEIRERLFSKTDRLQEREDKVAIQEDFTQKGQTKVEVEARENLILRHLQ